MSENAIVPVRDSIEVVRPAAMVGMVPTNDAGMWRIAKALIGSGLLPRGFDAPEKVVYVIQRAMEIGLPLTQACESLAIINGRVALWGDACKGLCYASGLLVDDEEMFDGSGDALCAVFRCLRKGQSKWHEERFSVTDARAAGLLAKDTYRQWLKPMLAARARGFGLRKKFPDVLKGLYTSEEMMTPAQFAEHAESASIPKSSASVSVSAATPSLPDLLDIDDADATTESPPAPEPEPSKLTTQQEADDFASLIPDRGPTNRPAPIKRK